MSKYNLNLFVLMLIFFSGFFSQVKSQSKINFRLTNSNSKAVEFATVLLSRVGDSALFMSFLSDSSGRFSIPNIPPNNYYLKISHLLYRDTVIYFRNTGLDSAKIWNVVLNERLVTNLKSITINGTRPLIEHLIDRTVFNVSNSVTITGGDAMDALIKSPGVQIINGNSINIIGRSGVKIMVNDRIVNLTGDDLITFLRSMPADRISKIEIITNPPAKYDASGNSGIINIISKKNKTSGISGSLRSSFTQGIYGYGTLSSELSYHNDKLTINGNLNGSAGNHLRKSNDQFDYLSETWNQTQIALNHSKNFSGYLGIDYQINKRVLVGIRYTGFYTTDSTQINSRTNINTINGLTKYSIITNSQSPVKNKNNDFNVHYESKLDTLGKKVTLDADYFVFNKILNQNYTSDNYLPDGSPLKNQSAQVQNYSPQAIKIYTLQNDYELPNKFINLSLGGKLSFIQNNSRSAYYNIINTLPVFDSTQSNNFNYSENTQALYISANKNKGKWSYQLGFRGEFTETKGVSKEYNEADINKYFKLFPTLYLNYKTDEDNTFSFNYNKRISRPDYWRLNPFRLYSSPYNYSQGNPFLQPAYTNNFEIGYNYKDILNSNLFTSIRSNVFDQIGIPDTTTKVVGIVERNFLKVYSFGLTQSISYSKVKWFETYNQFQIYYTNSISSDPHTQKQLKGFGAYISSDNTFFLNKAKTLFGTLNYWYQFPEISGVDKNDAYSDLDIGLKALFAKKKVVISIIGTDIFKTNKPTYHSFTNSTAQIYTNYFDSRALRVSLSYSFGGNKKVTRSSRSNSNDSEKSRTR